MMKLDVRMSLICLFLAISLSHHSRAMCDGDYRGKLPEEKKRGVKKIVDKMLFNFRNIG